MSWVTMELPDKNARLGRTLNETQWKQAENEFQHTGRDVLVWESDDGWSFWVIEHNGRMARKTVYKNESWIEYCMFRQT
jgi:hypothetical protein